MVICFKCFLGNEARSQEDRRKELSLNTAHTQRGPTERGGGAGANGDELVSYTPRATC